MSTTILYLAIVAIWAGFLVPAWIRRPHGAETHADDADEDGGDLSAYGAESAGAAAAAAAAADEVAGSEGGVDWQADGEEPDLVSASPHGRERMLRARRRVLATLLVLTTGAAACVARGLLPWWTAVPPAAVLTLYMLLLREVAKAEDEIARNWAHQAAQAARAATATRYAPVQRGATRSDPIAVVIDISSRVGDQLYDQYEDAAVRAVGD